MRDEGRWEEREGIVMERRKVKEEKKERTNEGEMGWRKSR